LLPEALKANERKETEKGTITADGKEPTNPRLTTREEYFLDVKKGRQKEKDIAAKVERKRAKIQYLNATEGEGRSVKCAMYCGKGGRT